MFLGALLFFLCTSRPAGKLTVIAAPLLFAVLVGNACSQRPWLARLHLRIRQRHAIACLAIGLITLGAGMEWAIANPKPTTGDQFATILCAGQDFLHGMNPYQTGEPQCLQHLGILTDANLTPLRAAPFNASVYPSPAQIVHVTRTDIAAATSAGFPHLGYPPLSFLAILPVAPVGFAATTVWVFALVILTLYLLARRDWRAAPWTLAATTLGLAWFIITWGGDPEILAFCTLILAVAYMDHPVVSAVMLGLAACSNELAWFAVPIYLIIGFRLPAARTRLFTLLATTLVVIGGWMLWDHHFLAEEWAFITQPLYAGGIGLVNLIPAAHLGSFFFDGIFILGLVTAYVTAWRRPQMAWGMLAVCWVCFWLSWRSLPSYDMPMLWLSPAVLLARDRTVGAAMRANRANLEHVAGGTTPTIHAVSLP
jgi:hypothetical protein